MTEHQPSSTGDPWGGGSSATHEALLAEQDVIETILNQLYPRWREDNPPSHLSRWSQHRQAAQRCLAQIERRAEVEAHLGFTGPVLSSEALHPWVWDAARPQWESGHYAEAVTAAARNVNSRTQQKLGRRDVENVNLVQAAFSPKPPEAGKPRLRVAEDDGSDTYKSLQEGALSFGSGVTRRSGTLLLISPPTRRN
jgi:hypothetical protein